MPLVIAVLSNINCGSYFITADDSQSLTSAVRSGPGPGGPVLPPAGGSSVPPTGSDPAAAPARQLVSSASAGCHVADPAMSTAPQLGPGSNPLPNLSESSGSGVPHGAGPGLRSEAAGGGGGGTGKQPSQFVYVFTTHLANT